MGMILVILIVYLIIWYIIARLMEKLAFSKGYNESAHTFAISFWLGFIGCAYVAILPDLVARKNNEELLEVQKNIYLALAKSDSSEQNTVLAFEEDDELPPL